MKYKNIKINDIDWRNKILVKYNDKYKKQLNHLKDINNIFASYIEKWPSYMDEDSKMQSYLIMDDLNNCYGGIFLYPSTANNQELVINYLMSNKYTNEFNYRVFDSVIKSLGEYFYEYQSFSINLYNGIELNNYDNSNYKKLYSIPTHSSYEYNNSKNNKKRYQLNDNAKNIEINLLEKKIKYSISDSYIDINVKTKPYDIRIFNPKNQNYKVMTYKSSKKNNSSNIVTMYVDDNNNILKLYVDYNIHKNAKDENKSKIKGIYTLIADNEYGIKEMKYISRSGWFNRYNFNSLEKYKKSLYDQVTSGILTIDSADELINIVANFFNEFNENKINISNKNMCQTMFEIYDYVLNILNNINLANSVSDLKTLLIAKQIKRRIK